DPAWVPVVLSGQSEAALLAQAARLRAHLTEHPEQPLEDVAFSLATTRTHFEHRAVVVAREHSTLLDALQSLSEGRASSGVRRGVAQKKRKLAFLFPGQGAQRPGMGRGLSESFPAFRAALEEAFAALDPHLPRPLREVMWAQDNAAGARLSQTEYTQ